MAIDPNEEIPQFTGYMDDPETWPATLPEGVTKDPAVWYAHRRTYGDGHTVWEFRKRGSSDGPDGKGDKVFATVPGMPVKSVKEAYDKDKTEAAKGDQEGDIRPSSGPTREVFRGGKWVVEPNPVYQPPAGQTTAGQTVQIEGTPDPGKQGGFDNERPVKVTRDAKGNQVGLAVPLTGKDLEDWRTDREKSRNPGNKTDKELADEKKAADDKARQTWLDEEAAARNKEASARATAGETRAGSAEARAAEDARRKAEENDFPAEPADAPALNLTPGQVAQGLQKYSSYLAAQVKLHKDTGGKQGISPQNASKLMDNRIKLAEATGRESTNLATQQQGILNSQVSQRGQTLQETGSRRGDANTAYNNNLARFVPNMTMMGAGGGQLVANALTSSLGANQAYVDQWGGFRESPEIQTPGFLQQIRDTSMAGINTAASGGPVLTGAAGAPPAATAAVSPPPSGADVAAQNAATQAQTGAAFAGATAPTPQTPPPPPPAVNPVGGQPITVPITPQGASMTSDPQTNAGAPTFDPANPPALTGAEEPGMMPAPATVNAKPSFLPMSPPEAAPFQDDQRGPGYGMPVQTTVSVEPQPTDLTLPPINTLPQGMMPSFLSQARYGTAYDPRQRAAMLGIRPDILELALAG